MRLRVNLTASAFAKLSCFGEVSVTRFVGQVAAKTHCIFRPAAMGRTFPRESFKSFRHLSLLDRPRAFQEQRNAIGRLQCSEGEAKSLG